jgi:1,6-anhydro-N-acetylmuramate kinase
LKQAEALSLSFEDMVATATAFTAKTIASSYKDFVLPVTVLDTVVVSGGGARNKTLLSMIQGYLPEGITVKPFRRLPEPREEWCSEPLPCNNSDICQMRITKGVNL